MSNHYGDYAMLLALLMVFYLVGLGNFYIPSNGDEYVYAQIARVTAASEHWLPLQSWMSDMRNTKPPLLIWQGMLAQIAGDTAKLFWMRLPSVLYTFLTTLMVGLMGWRYAHQHLQKVTAGFRIINPIRLGLLSALIYLSFFSTYRYGRPYLTNAPETFWLLLPLFVLLMRPQAFRDWGYLILTGASFGLLAWYKSPALILPAVMTLACWRIVHRQMEQSLTPRCLMEDGLRLLMMAAFALAIFALWFVFDPNPQDVWREFIVGENLGKFDPHGAPYWQKWLWGSSSIWSLALAFTINAGVLMPVMAALFIIQAQRWFQRGRAALPTTREERWYWLAILVFFAVFSLPSQRSGRYLLDVMPFVAVLLAIYWWQIPTWVFRIALAGFLGLILLISVLLASLQLQLQNPIYAPLLKGVQGFSWFHWSISTGLIVVLFWGIVDARMTRIATLGGMTLLTCLFASTLYPINAAWSHYDAQTQKNLRGKTISVPCTFRASEEEYRLMLPEVNVRGYSTNLSGMPSPMERFPISAMQFPLSTSPPPLCDQCRILGERLVLKNRHNAQSLDALFQGHFFEQLFLLELIIENPYFVAPTSDNPALLPQSTNDVQVCR